MRRGPVIVLGWLAVGAFSAATASAAVAYRITTDPPSPRAGEPTTVVVRTLFPAEAPATASEPQPLDDFPWTFVAESPSGRTHQIALERLGSSRHEWIATFTFDETGHWEIGLDKRHLGTPVDPTLGARLSVQVGDPDPPMSPITGAVAALSILAIAIASWLWISRRSAASARR
jgi:hypothetical protein